jgi:hypothetical protein
MSTSRCGTALVMAYCVFLAVSQARGEEPPEYKVTVHRITVKDGLITGDLYVNGKRIGACYENDEKKIPTGTYKGLIRTTSMKNHAQGPGGRMGNTGDFLLEVSGVEGRKDILFHSGNKKQHSLGCILCGPAMKDKDGQIRAFETLRQLRLLFFDGNDSPSSTPNKKIIIDVKE